MNMGLKCLATGLWPVLASAVALLALQERSRRAFVHVSEWGLLGAVVAELTCGPTGVLVKATC